MPVITVYGHTGNAFDGDDGCVYLDAPLTYHNKVRLEEYRGVIL